MSTEEFIHKYVLVCTKYSGFFVGTFENYSDNQLTLSDCRRLWRCDLDISELFNQGLSNSVPCELSPVYDKVILTNIDDLKEVPYETEKQLRTWQSWESYHEGD
jgi:hypothetical protein